MGGHFVILRSLLNGLLKLGPLLRILKLYPFGLYQLQLSWDQCGAGRWIGSLWRIRSLSSYTALEPPNAGADLRPDDWSRCHRCCPASKAGGAGFRVALWTWAKQKPSVGWVLGCLPLDMFFWNPPWQKSNWMYVIEAKRFFCIKKEHVQRKNWQLTPIAIIANVRGDLHLFLAHPLKQFAWTALKLKCVGDCTRNSCKKTRICLVGHFNSITQKIDTTCQFQSGNNALKSDPTLIQKSTPRLVLNSWRWCVQKSPPRHSPQRSG